MQAARRQDEDFRTSKSLTFDLFLGTITLPKKNKPEWRNWQTRGIQNPVLARECGFKSLLRHSP